jgi:hypothetical protein
MTRTWIVEHQDYFPVYGRTREEAETEAIHQWFGGEATEFVTAEAWGIITVKHEVAFACDVEPDVHPLFDIIIDIVRPPRP